MERLIEKDLPEAGLHTGWLEPKWYVLFVRSNQEKRVAQHLTDRAVEHFLPAFDSIRQWQDRKVKLLSPLFPGYVFVRLRLVERLKVLVVPNVVNLVGTRNAPSVVSDEEIEWVRRATEYGKAEPHPYRNLKVGSWVVIKAGAMAGMEGTLMRMQNGTRVLIGLNSIARAFTVEVDSQWVELGAHKVALQQAS
jgi:transcription antitermination factor NusG